MFWIEFVLIFEVQGLFIGYKLISTTKSHFFPLNNYLDHGQGITQLILEAENQLTTDNQLLVTANLLAITELTGNYRLNLSTFW